MDFIVGLPGENAQMVEYSMEEALNLNPDGITVHSLALKGLQDLMWKRTDIPT